MSEIDPRVLNTVRGRVYIYIEEEVKLKIRLLL